MALTTRRSNARVLAQNRKNFTIAGILQQWSDTRSETFYIMELDLKTIVVKQILEFKITQKTCFPLQ